MKIWYALCMPNCLHGLFVINRNGFEIIYVGGITIILFLPHWPFIVILLNDSKVLIGVLLQCTVTRWLVFIDVYIPNSFEFQVLLHLVNIILVWGWFDHYLFLCCGWLRWWLCLFIIKNFNLWGVLNNFNVVTVLAFQHLFSTLGFFDLFWLIVLILYRNRLCILCILFIF